MIATDPDITRLLGRLKARKLRRQSRDRHDRRTVLTRISDAGLELLRQMDPVVDGLHARLLGHMSRKDLAELVRLLELGRRFGGGNDAGRRPAGSSAKTCRGEWD